MKKNQIEALLDWIVSTSVPFGHWRDDAKKQARHKRLGIDPELLPRLRERVRDSGEAPRRVDIGKLTVERAK